MTQCRDEQKPKRRKRAVLHKYYRPNVNVVSRGQIPYLPFWLHHRLPEKKIVYEWRVLVEVSHSGRYQWVWCVPGIISGWVFPSGALASEWNLFIEVVINQCEVTMKTWCRRCCRMRSTIVGSIGSDRIPRVNSGYSINIIIIIVIFLSK